MEDIDDFSAAASCIMLPMMTFAEAIGDSERYSKRHLILGNGFSIGCRAEIFHYGSLYDKADFCRVPNAERIFEALKTQDFEVAIRALESSATLMPLYATNDAAIVDEMRRDADTLKEVLVQTIASQHPATPGDISDRELHACRAFLSHFLSARNGGHVFTLNYDLLLYWALMHDDDLRNDTTINLRKNDGFGNNEDDPAADYVVWQGETAAHSADVLFLHGALHLFDAGAELQKYTWVRRGVPLVEQARAAISDDKFPLFVSEGTSGQKKNKIRHNAYLYQCYKVLAANVRQGNHCFFVFGHSLAANDDHILRRLARGRFPKLYVGIYGNRRSESK